MPSSKHERPNCFHYLSSSKRHRPTLAPHDSAQRESESSQNAGVRPGSHDDDSFLLQACTTVGSSTVGLPSMETSCDPSLLHQHSSPKTNSCIGYRIQSPDSPSSIPLRRKLHSPVSVLGAPSVMDIHSQSMQGHRLAHTIPEQDIDVTTNTSTPGLDNIRRPPSIEVPCFVPDNRPGQFPHIDSTTLLELLGGRFTAKFDDVIVVDCRFKYEFDGGHIDGAVNCSDTDRLMDLFEFPKTRAALVLYCEYSTYRAPAMAKYVRQMDRKINIHSYPHLTYPDVYILTGGYNAFFHQKRSSCTPQNYVGMSEKDHELACERELGKIRKHFRHLS